jgi:hypothetical protein
VEAGNEDGRERFVPKGQFEQLRKLHISLLMTLITSGRSCHIRSRHLNLILITKQNGSLLRYGGVIGLRAMPILVHISCM